MIFKQKDLSMCEKLIREMVLGTLQKCGMVQAKDE